MKTAISRIILAAVLSLPVVLGSGGVAEAKPAERLTVNFVDAHYDLSGGINWILPSASFSYNNLQVYGYEYQWYTQSSEYDPEWVLWGDKVTVDFGHREKSESDIELPIPSTPWPHWGAGKAMITLYLIDHKGEYLHGYGPAEPAPAMYWYPTIPSLRFNFQVYEAAGYMYQWYHEGNPLGEAHYVWFDKIETSGTNLPVGDYRNINGSGKYTVDVWLIKVNGHVIQEAHLFAGFQTF